MVNSQRRSTMSEDTNVRHEDGYDLGTFNFLQTGWWILHFIAIVGVFYLGYLFGDSIF